MKAWMAVLTTSLLVPIGLLAQMPGRHPGYTRALQDLRFSRALLEHGQGWNWGRVQADQQRAVGEIDQAIGELSHAAMDDGRNPNGHPPIDMHWQQRDRLGRAMEALNRARDDIRHEEENPAAREMRNRAFRHIDMAQHALQHAMDAWH